MEVAKCVRKYCATLDRVVDITEHYSVEPTGACPISVNLRHWECAEEGYCLSNGFINCSLMMEYASKEGG